MRGTDDRTVELFSYVDLEHRVPAEHPLRVIRRIANEALETLSADFSELYSRMGRPSISPEMLLRAMLLQAFYSVRSERQLMERLEFDLLCRWFVGLGIDEPVWDHSTFSKNRDRLLAGEVVAKFLAAILDQPRVRKLLSREHFSVDGTLIEAWASVKSFRPKQDDDRDDEPGGGNGRNAPTDFRPPMQAALIRCHALQEGPYPDLAGPAYILFENNGGGEFAFGACTGHICEASSANAASIDFS